jgi:hypothetical protein
MRTATQKVSSRTAVKKRISAKTATRKKIATKKAVTTKSVVKKASSPVATTKKTSKVTAPTQATKVKKNKLVRDSFTIPKNEYVVIDSLKKRAIASGQAVKKSELLRAGIKALAAMSEIQFKAALSNVPPIKTGRPKKSK